jgi:hypothetical protein
MTVPMLSVNVDHVATVRQARRVPYPDPVEAARLAEAAGARGITAHLRADRRHIQEHDVARLREAVTTRLNLEIAATEKMVKVALEHRPDLVSLVPETPDEITTEGGLDLTRHRARVEEVARRLAGAGIAVSLFLDPDPRQIEIAAGQVRADHDGAAGVSIRQRPANGREQRHRERCRHHHAGDERGRACRLQGEVRRGDEKCLAPQLTDELAVPEEDEVATEEGHGRRGGEPTLPTVRLRPASRLGVS